MLAVLSTQLCAETITQPNGAPINTPSSVSAAPATATPTATIDCSYHIPAEQKKIDSALITQWAEKAALQSFTFTPTTIDSQLETLKACYTEQGWKGFYEALQKSGNVESIKTQSLNVSSQTDGTANINAVKDDQWKVTLPIQVVYQNNKEKVTQHLAVGLLVGRKPNGDLGIMQLVATAKPEENTQPANTNTETPANPTPSTPVPAKDMTSKSSMSDDQQPKPTAP